MAADASADNNRALYALLGVPPTATDDQIKRSYRQLATTLHPDKVADPAARDQAATLFSRVQEAYEVLSDPQRRDVYDVYGEEGLHAGLELGDPLRSREELRAEWEAFQARQRREALDASVNYRGLYQFKADATALVRPYRRDVARAPQLTSVYMTSGLDVPLEPGDWGLPGGSLGVAHLGGLVNVRNDVGGGSFLAGYKRSFADYSSLELHGAVGLRTLLSAQHSVQLSPDSSASLVASWQPEQGPGLQFVTTRQLSQRWSGEYSWVVGPPEAGGMSLQLTRREEGLLLTARLEVGAAMAGLLRCVKRLSEATTARLGLKLNAATGSAELDLGATRRFSEGASGGCTVAVGVQGVTLKLRYNRAGHLFEFPVLLTRDPRDWPVLAAACLAPPLAYLAGWALVVRPLQRSAEAWRTRSERRRHAATIRDALAEAAAAGRLMAPVAARRLERERRAGGLVVALALYGDEHAVLQAGGDALRRAAAAQQAQQAAPDAAAQQAAPDAAAQQAAPSPAASQQEASGEGQAQQPGTGGAADGVGGCEEVPPAVADVTTAVRYMVDGGRLAFHKGYSKASLMGFCDPAPSATKLLLVFFTSQGQPLRATISDTEGAQLPARGAPLEDAAAAAAVLSLAEAAPGGGALAAAPSAASLGGSGELWRDNPSFVHRSGSGGLD